MTARRGNTRAQTARAAAKSSEGTQGTPPQGSPGPAESFTYRDLDESIVINTNNEGSVNEPLTRDNPGENTPLRYQASVQDDIKAELDPTEPKGDGLSYIHDQNQLANKGKERFRYDRATQVQTKSAREFEEELRRLKTTIAQVMAKRDATARAKRPGYHTSQTSQQEREGS